MTSTSTKFLAVLIILLAPLGAAQNGVFSDSGFSDSNDSFSDDKVFVMPEYDSQREVLFELVVPFIGIMVILQFGVFNALSFTIATNTSPYRTSKSEKAKMRKYSVVLSLIITAMLVPTPYWDIMRTALSGLGILAVGGFFLVVGMVLYYMLGFGGDGNDD
jgi:hypothetical protein